MRRTVVIFLVFFLLVFAFSALLRAFLYKEPLKIEEKNMDKEKKVSKQQVEPEKVETEKQMAKMVIRLEESLPRRESHSVGEKSKKTDAVKSEAVKSAQLKKEASIPTVLVNEKHLAAGAKALSDGKAPFLSFNYSNVGAATYFSIMKSLGGAVHVGNASTRTILAEAKIAVSGKKVLFTGLKYDDPEIAGLALTRPRELVGEPLAKDIAAAAARKFGQQEDLRIIVLLPQATEEAFLGAVEEAMLASGHTIEEFATIEGYYLDSRTIEITKGIKNDSGQEKTLKIRLDLSGLL